MAAAAAQPQGSRKESRTGREREEPGEPDPKRSNTEEAQRSRKDPKRAKVTCLNFTGNSMQHIRHEADVVDVYIEENPMFIVVGNCQPAHVEHAMQRRNVEYFIDVSGSDIVTISAAVMSVLKAEGVLESVGLDGEGLPKGKVAEGTEARVVEGVVN